MDFDFNVAERSHNLAERFVKLNVIERKDIVKYAPAFVMRDFDWFGYDNAVLEGKEMDFMKAWKTEANQWLFGIDYLAKTVIEIRKEENKSAQNATEGKSKMEIEKSNPTPMDGKRREKRTSGAKTSSYGKDRKENDSKIQRGIRA